MKKIPVSWSAVGIPSRLPLGSSTQNKRAVTWRSNGWLPCICGRSHFPIIYTLHVTWTKTHWSAKQKPFEKVMKNWKIGSILRTIWENLWRLKHAGKREEKIAKIKRFNTVSETPKPVSVVECGLWRYATNRSKCISVDSSVWTKCEEPQLRASLQNHQIVNQALSQVLRFGVQNIFWREYVYLKINIIKNFLGTTTFGRAQKMGSLLPNTSVQWRAEGAIRGDDPGYPGQGASKGWKLKCWFTKIKMLQLLHTTVNDFSYCKATNTCCVDLSFRNLFFCQQ